MTETDKKRCNSLVAQLFFVGGASSARVLRDELEAVHGISVTLDRVRSDITWLADIGLVVREGDIVALTEDGREVANGRRKLP